MVSIIIPTYKRSDSIRKAIDSVLNQTYTHTEIIVVDDNDDDFFRKKTYNNLKVYIEKKEILYLSQRMNQGGCKARNIGGFKAKGDYITFLDDDDFYEPTKIEKQVDFLKKNPDLDACACAMYRIDENENHIISKENFPRGETLKEAILNGNIFTGMLMIKKNVFIKLEGFSNIPRFQDKYFHYKFLERNYKIGFIENQLLTLVEHNNIRISLSSNKKVIKALNILDQFELKNRILFSKKEWKFLLYRSNYTKAFTLCEGSFSNKINAIKYIFKSLKYYTNDTKIFKLALKAIIPNFILKLNKNKAI